MSNANIIEDPLFQLNMLIFLTWSAPVDGQVYPIFSVNGYELSFIEVPLTVPDAIHLRLNDNGIRIQRTSKPDLFLEHPDTQMFVPLECKKNWFGVTSSTADQARSLLVMNGQELSRYIGKAPDVVWQSTLTYMTVAGRGSLLLTTLQQLCHELSAHGIETANTACVELAHLEDGIYLTGIPSSHALPGVDLSVSHRVMAISEGEDPRPLYLIPYTLSGTHNPDPITERVFQERIRVAVATLLSHVTEQEQEHSLDDLLQQVIPVWSIWGNDQEKRAIRRYVRSYLQNTFREVNKQTNLSCGILNQTIHLSGATSIVIDAVRKYVMSNAFRKQDVPVSGPLQGTLELP